MSRVFIGQFKGAKGDKGDTGSKGDRGDIGATGERGSRIMRGTAITGTSTTGKKFPSSGITDAKIHDYYINTDTGNLYECTVPGAANTAEWTHAGSFKGPKGDTGPAGSISEINEQKPTYTEANTLANISSGETVKIAFGKLKKALSILISHYTQQATAAVLGHVKLSNSAAVTQTGLMALDAVEKNAAIAGTLANQISQANSNISEQIYDFETSTFLNNITYVTRLSEWYPKNKIYKIGRICWMSLGIKTKNVTENDKVLNVAAIPDAFAPIAVVSKRSSDYTVGIYPGNNLLYASERDVTKFPNWSDVAGEGKEEFIEFNFVYFSKI